MNHDSNQSRARQPYTPPKITKVRLIVEEAVLAGCKGPSASGPGYAACLSGAGGPCVEGGS
ncbi:MAG: hypothetical protein AB1646_06305 [Thermodesulfobacteriota bacterium]